MADNLLDKASILLTPTAYDNGSMLSIKPENGDGDFDFQRNGNASRVDSSGNIVTESANLPRIDYTDGCGSWLLEPQSTNTVSYSSDYPQWVWGGNSNANNTTRVDNQSSLDGETNATLFTRNTGTSGWFSPSNLSVTLNQTYTYSLFVKKGTSSTIELRNVSNTPQSIVSYNINTNTFTTEFNATGNSVSYGNGWYRIAMTFEHLNSSGTSAQIRHTLEDGESMYVFGSQFENLSYPTSYIPTNGSIATRLADVCSLDVSGLGLSEITEHFSDGTSNVITSIPATYTVSTNNITKIIAE